VLWLGPNPNCSSRSSPRQLISLKILVSRIFSNNLPIVCSRLIGWYDEGSDGSFPGFRMEITRALLLAHAQGVPFGIFESPHWNARGDRTKNCFGL
jgi:hypothetical protein